ncbi:MAG: hypothetical protein HYR85_06000 [Planctomycetes bacterium]|nr:hypothetical protein [Planctomycetota bacterium]MBI3846285.1 hypothetical protein [Planctomycetota bacterium]
MKAFLVVMAVLVVLLGGAILYAAHQVSKYDEAIDAAHSNYKAFLEKTIDLKQNQQRVLDEKVDLNNPLEYVYSQVEAAGVTRTTVKCAAATEDNSNIRKGYVDTKIEVTFQAPVKREQITRFLHLIESNSAILKAFSVTMPKVDSKDKSDEWKNVKVVLAYRKPYVKKS